MNSLHLSAYTVQLIITFFIPVITGLITKRTLSKGAKGLITLILSLISALITTSTLADGTAVISQATFLSWFLGFAIAVASYAGVWQPNGITSNTSTSPLLPNVGIGPSIDPPGTPNPPQ